jgi:GDP-4-dehydro-6-deoxy-D-mannose reductase
MFERAILITGVAGFTGRHLLAHLAQAEPAARIIGVDQRPAAWLPPVSEQRGLDLLDAAAVRSLIADVRPHVVYHLVGLNKSDDPAAYYRINVLTTLHLLEALRVEAPSARLLAVGSAAEYGPPAGSQPLAEDAPLRPATVYGASKAAQAILLQSYARAGLAVFLARPFNLLGPGLPANMAAAAFAAQIVEREQGQVHGPIRVGNLAPQRDFLDVRDAARAYRLIVQRGAEGAAYNVCSGRPVSIQALLDLLVGMARCPVDVTVDAARFQASDVPVSVGDNRRLAALGWVPRVSLEQSLADLLREQRGEGGDG